MVNKQTNIADTWYPIASYEVQVYSKVSLILHFVVSNKSIADGKFRWF